MVKKIKKINETAKYVSMAYIFAITAVVAYYSKFFITEGINEWYHFIFHPNIVPGDSFYLIGWMVADILLGAAFMVLILRLPAVEFPKYNYPFLGLLILQFLWCYAFFFCKQLGWGLVIMLPYTILAFRSIRIFKEGEQLAAQLLYPYFAFILYTTFVNMSMVTEHGLTAELYM